MAADSRITLVDRETGAIQGMIDDIRKIYRVKKNNIGISYWGLATIEGKSMLEFLEELENERIGDEDNVDSIARKLVDCLQKIKPPIDTKMGLHIAGYLQEKENYYPKLRHVFHENWHSAGKFTNEDCHIEFHQKGKKIRFPSYNSYPVLFNGDNNIANCLFNYIPIISNQRIRSDLITLDESLDLAEIILSLAIQRLNYYFNPEGNKIYKSVGGKIYIARIRPKIGFDWYKE